MYKSVCTYVGACKLGFDEQRALEGERVYGGGAWGSVRTLWSGWSRDSDVARYLVAPGNRDGERRLASGEAAERVRAVSVVPGHEGQATGDRDSFVSRTEWARQRFQSGTGSETGKEERDPAPWKTSRGAMAKIRKH